MTPKDKQKQAEWEAKVAANKAFLATLGLGDEIVITNTYNVTNYEFGNMAKNEPFNPEVPVLGMGDQTEEICEFHTVRGITTDGSFVVSKFLYTKEGKPETVDRGYNKTELWKPTQELRDLADKLVFVKTVRDFSFRTWKEFDINVINSIQNTMKEQLAIINA